MPPRHSEEPIRSPHPVRQPRRRRRRRRREDQVQQQRPARERAPADDRVTRTQFAGQRAIPREPVRQPPLVLPGWRHMATLAAPDAVATFSLLLAFATAVMMGGGSPVFVLPMILPSIVLGGFNGSRVGQGWRVAVSVNLATMLVLFPLLVIRQSTVRVPYLDPAHGTVFAAVLSTAAVLMAMAAIALFTAWASRQDPESAPLLFLPAAMMVPLLTSATEFGRLEVALPIASLILALATGLTLTASMLPPVYTVFVAPLAVAAEVLFVTVIRQDRIFPTGGGETGMALFSTVIVAAIGLVVLVPALSAWMQQVEAIRTRQSATVDSPESARV